MARRRRSLLAVLASALTLGSTAIADQPHGRATICAPQQSEAGLRQLLSFLNEVDLKPFACDLTRETYRIVRHDFHLTESAQSLRLEIGPTGQAAITVRETDVILANNQDRPKLTLDRARVLQQSEIESFLEKVDASQFWTMSTAANSGIARKIKGDNGEELTQECSPIGSFTILEAVRHGAYHEVEWMCFAPDAFDDLLEEFTRLHQSASRR